MKYVALFTGAGEGCDTTIGCNKNFEVFDVKDHAAALKHCKQEWEDHGGSGGEPRIEDIELFVVAETVSVPVSQWNDDDESDQEREAAEKELRETEEKAKELRERLGKKGGWKNTPTPDASGWKNTL